MHPAVFEFGSDKTEAEEENPHVVGGARLVVRPLVFRAGALGVQCFGGDCEAELNVGFDLSGVGRSVEKPELDRSRPPHVVEVNRAVACLVVVFGGRGESSEPRSVEGVLCGGLRFFEAVDELAVGALCKISFCSPL